MKKIILLATLLLSLVLAGYLPAMAQPASETEALTVATNWIEAIIAKKGSWGEAKTAEVAEIIDFSRNGKQVGYFCKVSPKGYIIVSLRKEMAPVKAYSATSELDPDSEEGLADLIKGNMAGLLNRIEAMEEANTLPDAASGKALGPPFEIDYRPVWDNLLQGKPASLPDHPGAQKNTPDPLSIDESVDGASDTSGGESADYAEGEVLLTSDWHQSAPYNNETPTGASVGDTCARTLVGCVATAGAQILRYWNWPPYGEGSSTNNTPTETVSHTDPYDWVNMPDSATTSSPAAQQAAVAELSHEVGVAVSMEYGCSSSGAYTYDMEQVYEDHYRMGTWAERINRSSYTATTWFADLQYEFNHNRPVQYRIVGHSIVGDGWQTVGSTNQYHMNYGWVGTGSDTWYTVDTMTPNPSAEEYVIRYILPITRITTLTGSYPKDSFRYRYFYADTVGGPGTFSGGNYIQFLPGVAVTATTGTVTFENAADWYTRLFTKGDLGRGIYLPLGTGTTSAVKLHANGSIKFHK